MNFGFIGTGKIASSVITGICKSSINYNKIFISSRNIKIANRLKKKFKRVIIEKDNQTIINNCSWVFLSITPSVGKKIIKSLKFKLNQTIISFISTITISELKKMIKVKADIIRAIPLPPISLKKGPVPICPPHKKVKNFFNKIGSTVEINNEKLSLNFWTMSSMMAPYYEMLNNFSLWLIRKGLNRKKAENYITSLFLALSKNADQNTYKDLSELVKKSQTPRGLNEQSLKELKKSNFYKKLNNTSDKILKRLKGN